MSQPGRVDPALWAEVQRLTDRLHTLANWQADENEQKSPPFRMTVEMEPEWFLLFAWLEQRRRAQRRGENGAIAWTVERLTDPAFKRVLRRSVKARLLWLLNEAFHVELHQLCTGDSPYLRPLPPTPECREPPRGDLDDDIPF